LLETSQEKMYTKVNKSFGNDKNEEEKVSQLSGKKSYHVLLFSKFYFWSCVFI